MALFLAQRWRRQPQVPVEVDRASIFASSIRHLFLGSQPSLDLGTRQPWDGVTTLPPRRFIADGLGDDLLATSYSRYANTTVPPAAGWTQLVVLAPTAAYTNAGSFIGMAEDFHAGTFDRQWGLTVAPALQGYLYDGAQKFANGAVSLNNAIGRPCVGVITANPGLMSLWARVDGVLDSGSVAVGNSGYTGYATPKWIMGDSNNSATAAPEQTILLAAMIHEPWPEAKARAFLENPWQLFRPQQRRIYVNAGATGDTLMPQACF